MKELNKVRITLDDYRNLEEACSNIALKLDLENDGINDIPSLQEQLMKISKDIVIELRQINTIPDELLPLQRVFEDLQQNNDDVYLIRGIG